jgi:hypothetical protein
VSAHQNTPVSHDAQKPRGKTRRGRLARLDALILHRERALFARNDGEYEDACVIDVGVGEEPHTTLELAASLATLATRRKLIGVEIDRERFERARRVVIDTTDLREHVELRHGGAGFALPLEHGERALWVRAMNLLRGYSEDAACVAHATLATSLVPGGVLVEGSGSPEGGVLCAHLLRRGESDGALHREALFFVTDFSQGFAPQIFRDRLPRDLRKHAKFGGVLHPFFEGWQASFVEARGHTGQAPRTLFEESARRLAMRVEGVEQDEGAWGQGVMVWRPFGGVPRGKRAIQCIRHETEL